MSGYPDEVDTPFEEFIVLQSRYTSSYPLHDAYCKLSLSRDSIQDVIYQHPHAIIELSKKPYNYGNLVAAKFETDSDSR